jgi:hypothetical protein
MTYVTFRSRRKEAKQVRWTAGCFLPVTLPRQRAGLTSLRANGQSHDVRAERSNPHFGEAKRAFQPRGVSCLEAFSGKKSIA